MIMPLTTVANAFVLMNACKGCNQKSTMCVQGRDDHRFDYPCKHRVCQRACTEHVIYAVSSTQALHVFIGVVTKNLPPRTKTSVVVFKI